MIDKTGGPAFPEAGLSNLPNGEFIYGMSGMTLHDYFAAKAMQAMCEEVSRYGQFDECAKNAYKLADSMLAERAKQ